MENYLLMKKSKELEEFSTSLGFKKTLFLEDFEIIKGNSKKDLLKKIKEAQKKKLLIFYIPDSEEMLRFALEKTAVDVVMGMESINPKDSVHFVRGGLDQITCKISKEKGKVIGFSFYDILNAKNNKKLLGRMAFNVKLCRKYKVKMLFSTFASDKWEMRGRKDLEAMGRVLGM